MNKNSLWKSLLFIIFVGILISLLLIDEGITNFTKYSLLIIVIIKIISVRFINSFNIVEISKVKLNILISLLLVFAFMLISKDINYIMGWFIVIYMEIGDLIKSRKNNWNRPKQPWISAHGCFCYIFRYIRINKAISSSSKKPFLHYW